MSKIERGLASPSFDVITRLCNGTNATPLELFGVYDGQWHAEDPTGPLLVAEAAMNQVFAPSPVGFFISTLSGRLKLATDSFGLMFGYQSGEEMQRKVRNLAKDIYLNHKDRQELLVRVSSNGGLASHQSVLRHRNGDTFQARIFIRNCFGQGLDDPLLVGFLLPSTD